MTSFFHKHSESLFVPFEFLSGTDPKVCLLLLGILGIASKRALRADHGADNYDLARLLEEAIC